MSSSNAKPRPIRSTADFAHHVGLSRSTVSRVLNGRPGLRKENVERVRAALAETGFTPNAHALNLRGKRAPTVGVCLENFANPTAVAKVAALQRLLRARGLTALIEVMDPGASRPTIAHFLSLRVGAVVFIGHFDPGELAQRIRELSRHGTPHLVIDDAGLAAANTITLHRVKAAARVTTRLLALGHRQFGLLGISGPYQTIRDRVRGIHQALRRHGLDPAAATLSFDDLHTRTDHFEYGRLLAQTFVKQRRLPTACIAVNDETAVGALLEFQAAGLRVPEDISIIGFNNQNICLMTKPHLSSVDQQIEKTIEVAVATLLGQIGRPVRAEPITHLIEPQFIERGSTGPAKKHSGDLSRAGRG